MPTPEKIVYKDAAVEERKLRNKKTRQDLIDEILELKDEVRRLRTKVRIPTALQRYAPKGTVQLPLNTLGKIYRLKIWSLFKSVFGVELTDDQLFLMADKFIDKSKRKYIPKPATLQFIKTMPIEAHVYVTEATYLQIIEYAAYISKALDNLDLVVSALLVQGYESIHQELEWRFKSNSPSRHRMYPVPLRLKTVYPYILTMENVDSLNDS